MDFKISVTQFYENLKCKQEKRTKSDNFPQDILKPDIIFQWSQNSIVFQRFIKSKSVNFVTKMKTNLGNEKN